MRRSSFTTTFISGNFMLGACVFGAVVAANDAEARLDLYVDKSTQRIQIIQNGSLLYVWPVSTGRDRFSTPNGVYAPERLERSWFSRAYYNAPMPHAIFFHNGYAIHGSYDIARLGGPASHGCVRLHPRNAALLFAMVQQEGPGNTTIFVGGNSHRPLLQYRDGDEAWRPPYRRDVPAARSYPPEPGIDPRMPPGEGPDRYVDRRGAYPPSGPETPYYGPDRYDGQVRYPDQDRYLRGPDGAPYSETDRYIDRRRVPHTPRIEPDYTGDPYANGRGAPRGQGGFSPYYPDRSSDGRGAAPHGPKSPPYDADRYADEPARRHGDSPLAMRGADPPNRMPASRLNGEMPVERMPVERPPGLHGTLRPVTASAKPTPGRPADELPGHRATTGDTARMQPPAPTQVLQPVPTPAASTTPPPAPPAPAPTARQEPLPEQQESNGWYGYKVLPKSYWAGASWRWRMKRDDDAAPPASPQ
jgi:L,D-transpeptidase catalytic domain